MKYLGFGKAAIITSTAAIFLAGAGAALSATIDFEDVDLISTFGVTSISSRGFTFTARNPGLGTLINGNPCAPDCAANGAKTLSVSGFGAGVGSGDSGTQPVRLTNDRDLPFQLLGLDVAEFTSTPSNNADRIQLTGNVVGGGSISQVLLLDGVNDGPGGVADFQSAELDTIWDTTLLLSLDFQGFRSSTPSFFNEAFMLDNVRVRAVPEPSTLLGTAMVVGLGTLHAMRRREAAR